MKLARISRRRAAAGGTIAAILLVGFLAATASASWSTQSTYNAPFSKENQLRSISCLPTEGDFCMAVGDSVSSFGSRSTLGEKLSGSGWGSSAPATPSGSEAMLLGVSCASIYTCVAVGRYTDIGGTIQALAEVWEAETGTWTLQTLPMPTGETTAELGGISCGSNTFCVAVGDFHDSTGSHFLVERWSIHGWSVQTPSDTGLAYPGLRAISCPLAERCMAVGGYRESSGRTVSVSDEWKGGTSWTVRGTSNPTGDSELLMNSISCPESFEECIAVGSYKTTTAPTGRALAEGWNSLWSMQSPTNPHDPNYLKGIACRSIKSCVAVGETFNSTVMENLGEEYGGLITPSWSTLTIPNGSSTGSQLGAVSCISINDCYAVGSYLSGTERKTLASHN